MMLLKCFDARTPDRLEVQVRSLVRTTPVDLSRAPDQVLSPESMTPESIREGLEKTFEDYADQARIQRDWSAVRAFQFCAAIARFYGLRHVSESGKPAPQAPKKDS